MQAVRKVLAGEISWNERVAAQVACQVARSVRASGSPMDLLSEREPQVFELIGSGISTSAVAAMLHIGVSTVESYRTRIKEKMNLRDAGELLQAAIRWGVAKGDTANWRRPKKQENGCTIISSCLGQVDSAVSFWIMDCESYGY